MKTLILSGGSGGHLIPAMVLAERLKKDGSCTLLSTARPVDRLLSSSLRGPGTSSLRGPGTSSLRGPEGAEAIPLNWLQVDLKQFTPLWRWLAPPYLIHQCRAVAKIWRLLRAERPDLVVGFGGYLSAVGLVGARLWGFPAVLHEQNLLPGRANRLLCRLADRIAVSFPETVAHLPSGAAVEVTGNPIRYQDGKRSRQEALRFFGFDGERPVLLIMGGSQGSRVINETVFKMWEIAPPGLKARIQVIHLGGAGGGSRIQSEYRRWGMEARVYGFLLEIDFAYAAATLAVCRAGATAIAEMTAFGLPAILIPYLHAGGHQEANARWMESAAGAVVLSETLLSPERLWEKIEFLLWSPEPLQRMRRSLRAHADGDAADRLAALAKSVAQKGSGRPGTLWRGGAG